MWNPHDISQDDLKDLRRAAELAWGDDVRHPSFIGHPDNSQGSCYVTSRWLKNRLGGFVGVKKGHHFWVSPDKQYVIDLTGDLFSKPPEDPNREGEQLDQDDEPWVFDPSHKRYRLGPPVYVKANNPLYRNFRILDDVDHDRATIFNNRANAYMKGQTPKQADLLGADPYPGSEPQAQEDYDMETPMPMLHDELPSTEPDQEYRFVIANGQVNLSPMHSHQELLGFSGMTQDSQSPLAVGYAKVQNGRVEWHVTSNMGLRGLHRMLSDYSDNMGWGFDGMLDSQGQTIHDDFGSKRSMWYKERDDGHTLISPSPLPNGKRIDIIGKTAHINQPNEAIEEWAVDFGYRLAEFPGGGNMLDHMKKRPNLDLYNRGDQDFTPEKDDTDLDMRGNFECSECGEHFQKINELIDHDKSAHPKDREEVDQNHFPWPADSDAPLGFGTFPYPSQMWDGLEGAIMINTVSYIPLTNPPYRYVDYSAYKDLFGYDDSFQFYGVFYQGQQVGYGACKDCNVVHVSSVQSDIDAGLLSFMKSYGNVSADGSMINNESLYQAGFVNTSSTKFAASKGKDPKDMIEAAIPFIYDVHKKHIQIGYAGEQTRDIQPYRGEFSKGGIVEGEYRPGGKMIIYPSNTTLYTTRQIAQTWYTQFPHMEIKSIEIEQDGKTHKIARGDSPYGVTVRTMKRDGFTEDQIMDWSNYLADHNEDDRDNGELDQLGDEQVERWYENWESDGMPHVASSSDMDPGNYIKVLTAANPASSMAYEALKHYGAKVYVVGGAVRDVLRGQEPKDIDMMVAGLPTEEVHAILSKLPGRVDLTGKRFGVYRYRHDGQEVEIALPRQDKYETARRGEGVITVDHTLPLEKDLERRDFTVNSMAVDLDNGQVIDPFGGKNDLENNILRTTHPDAFKEDPTRLVRALTAHSRFGLNPDETTRHEMVSNADMLRHESPDALNKILDKLFASNNPASAIRLAQDTGILHHLFPEVADNWDYDQKSKYHQHTLGEHQLQVLDNVSKYSTDPDLRLAGLIHDIGKPNSEWTDDQGYRHFYRNEKGEGADHAEVGAKMGETRMRALNYPNARIKRVTHLINNHMFPRFNSQKGARKFIQRVGDEHADDLLTLGQADGEGHGFGPDYWTTHTATDTMRGLVDEVRKGQQPTDLSNLAVKGQDLLNLGVPQGPEIGRILRQLLEDVVQNPQDNNYEKLLQIAKGYM